MLFMIDHIRYVYINVSDTYMDVWDTYIKMYVTGSYLLLWNKITVSTVVTYWKHWEKLMQDLLTCDDVIVLNVIVISNHGHTFVQK